MESDSFLTHTNPDKRKIVQNYILIIERYSDTKRETNGFYIIIPPLPYP